MDRESEKNGTELKSASCACDIRNVDYTYIYTHITHLSAATHSELLEGADVIDKQVHQPEFV